MSTKKNLPHNAVWFVTGCSSGLGAAFGKEILEQGFRLVATARKPETLSFLPDDPARVLKLQLDVTSETAIQRAVSTAVEKFGRIDVALNNAGYGLFGAAEATSDEEARRQMDTNFFGCVNVTKAVLNVFREVNSTGDGGVVLQMSSMGGMLAFPANAFYHASKFALEGFTESVSKEMSPDWNIDFLLLEPGGVKTEFAKGSMAFAKQSLPAYADPEGPVEQLKSYVGNPEMQKNWASPEQLATVVVSLVSKRGDKPLPVRLALGADAFGLIKAKLESVAKEMEHFKNISQSLSSEDQLRSLNFTQ